MNKQKLENLIKSWRDDAKFINRIVESKSGSTEDLANIAGRVDELNNCADKLEKLILKEDM